MCATGNLSIQICPGIRHLVLVVCPLNALMRDQVDRWRKVGVSCAAILGKTAMCEEDVTGMLAEFHNFSPLNIQDGNILETVYRTDGWENLEPHRSWFIAVFHIAFTIFFLQNRLATEDKD